MIVRCATCKAPYEERENLLKPGRVNWYPTCKHPASLTSAVVLADDGGEVRP
jgi:hypothetical protein